MKLLQHLPEFVTGIERHAAEVATLDDLKRLEWVQPWAEDPDFYRFSVSPHLGGREHLLMCEFQGGKKWWVVAYIEDVPLPELPVWREPTRANS